MTTRCEVLVVNFWVRGVPALPELEAPASSRRSRSSSRPTGGLPGMNIYDQAPTAMSFAEEFGVTYPSILDANDGSVRLAFAGQVAPNAVPTTLVLDQQGRVAARISGVISEPSVLRSMITDVLAEDVIAIAGTLRRGQPHRCIVLSPTCCSPCPSRSPPVSRLRLALRATTRARLPRLYRRRHE